MLRRFLHHLGLGLGLAMAAAPLTAQSVTDILAAELLPGWQTATGTRMAAIRLTMAPGWKTYWRSPGEAGIPPEFDWRGSTNVAGVALHWPVPEVFDFNGMQTIGYAHELVLPVEIRPRMPGQPVELRAAVDLGVCRDICVPANVQLQGQLATPASTAPDPVIRAALQAQPRPARAAGLQGHHCAVTPAAQGLHLRAELNLPRLGPDEMVVIESTDPRIWVAEAHSRREGGRLVAETDLIAIDRQPLMLDRSGLTITVLAAGRAVEVQGCPAR